MALPLAQSNAPATEMIDVSVASMRDQSLLVAEHVNWRVEPGDYWAIAGLQGSGKSDLLMTTGGVMPPVHGEYRLLGELMPIFDSERLKHRLRLGLAFETGQLFNHLTVAENLTLPLRYHTNLGPAEARPMVQPLLEAMEIAPWADSTPGTLGRNWQKRVGLARALALKPEVLLVDSPLTGLDVRHATWWLAFMDALSKGHPLLDGRQLTLVVTTADLRPWKGHARRFAVLNDKKFSVQGEWSQLENVAEEFVRELLTT